MAVLGETPRAEIWAKFMQVDDGVAPWTKQVLRAAFDRADDWAEAEKANYVAALGAVTVGNATFDLTGGGVENEWTLAAHGLVVGDEVRFTVVGTGAEPHLVDQDYYVVNVPDANTFQLSQARNGSVELGTGTDSAGTWTVEDQRAQKFVDQSNAGQKALILAYVLDKRWVEGS